MTQPPDVILILDDEPDMLRTLNRLLTRMGYECHAETEPERAIERVHELAPDILLTDLRLPVLSGLDVLRQAKMIHSDMAVILITAYATIETAVEAIKEGASDYISKPFTADALKAVIEKGLEPKRARERQRVVGDNLQATLGAPPAVGESPNFQRLLEDVVRVAGSDANVLLLGESGTGKEVIARRIHALSMRGAQAFIPIDCSALSETLLESEFFGYEKGAFTGADSPKPGLLEYAHGGTCFLDEIGQVPPRIQSRLLRVLQERVFRRVGGREEKHVDIRVVAATNSHLDEEVRAGAFRADLFYRLNCITLTLPPLRERRDDIALLARHFVVKHGRHSPGETPRISTEALEALHNYDWPGNVRELENAVHRALVWCRDDLIKPTHLPEEIVGEAVHDDDPEALEDVRRRSECVHIQKVLRETGGHRGKAAKILGISRKTLWEKMRAFGL